MRRQRLSRKVYRFCEVGRLHLVSPEEAQVMDQQAIARNARRETRRKIELQFNADCRAWLDDPNATEAQGRALLERFLRDF